MELSENALKVLEARYLLKDEEGKVIESPREMFCRTARTIAAAENLYDGDARLGEEKFFLLLSQLKFLPNSPTIMNAGKSGGQVAACFVLPVEDSMQSIFDTDNAVSKTINLPFRATREDVEKAYILAYAKGVKGITVFRYGAKKGTLVKFADTD